ncbi:MAG: anti-sigma factor family protein [Frankia sp.]
MVNEELSSDDAHLELGAYLLDALEPDERVAFERHLAGCLDCQAELADWAVIPPLLGRLPLSAVLAEPDLGGLLDPDLELGPDAGGLPDQADRRAAPTRRRESETAGSPAANRRPAGRPGGRRRRATHATGPRGRGPAPVRPSTGPGQAHLRTGSRGRRYIAAVVGALVLVLGGALGLNLTGGSSSQNVTFALVAPRTVAGATVAPSGTAELRPSGSGSTLTVDVSGIEPGTECVVLVTGRDGRTVQVTTWTATYQGEGSATAKTNIAPTGIRAVAIRDAATNGTIMASRA